MEVIVCIGILLVVAAIGTFTLARMPVTPTPAV
jgi:hypothetical protein